MNQSNFQSKSFQKLIFRIIVLAIGAFLLFLGIRWLGNAPIRDIKSSTMEMVKGMPGVTYANVPEDMTYGEFFDQTTRNQKWKTFESGYVRVVELNAISNDGEKVCIQFNMGFPGYTSIDDEEVDRMDFFSILNKQRN